MQEKLLPVQTKQIGTQNETSNGLIVQTMGYNDNETKCNQFDRVQFQQSATTQSQILQNNSSDIGGASRQQLISNSHSSGPQEIIQYQRINHQKQSKRVYSRVTDQQRQMFIRLVTQDKIQIRNAAEMAGIGYENSKSILKVYKKEGRQHTLLFQDQVIKRRRRKQVPQRREFKTPILPQSNSSCSKDNEIINNIISGVNVTQNQPDKQRQSYIVKILIPKQQQQLDRQLPMPEMMPSLKLDGEKLLDQMDYGIPAQVNPFLFK